MVDIVRYRGCVMCSSVRYGRGGCSGRLCVLFSGRGRCKRSGRHVSLSGSVLEGLEVVLSVFLCQVILDDVEVVLCIVLCQVRSYRM